MKFKISDNVLKRCDRNMLTQYTRNEAFAEFSFSHEWKELEPKTAQFRNGDDSYDALINDGRCTIPWEVLTERGTLEVTVLGGDLKTTNTVRINIVGNGLIGGLVPTKASPSVYSYLVDLYEAISKKVDKILKGDFSDNDLKVDSQIDFSSEGLDIKSKDDGTILQMGERTGIRLMNSINGAKDAIKIGFAKSKDHYDDDNFEGIYYHDNKFMVGNDLANEGKTLISLSNESGSQNQIRGNETLKIISDDGQISFATDDAGINYTAATWTENFRQLDVFTTKGVKMETANNSYWYVNAEKKAQYGNSLNKLEFRTDGVAKFSNTVNATDYQIGGTPIMDKVEDKVEDKLNTALENASKSGIDSVYNALALNHGGIKAVYNCGLGNGDSAGEDIKAIVCRDNSVIIYGDGDMFGKEDELYSNEDISLLNGVYIAEGVTNISERYFSGFTNLSKIVLPNTVSSIEQYAFYNCKSLEEIYIPKKVVSIENYTFYNCSALRGVVLAESLQSIGSSAFYRCSALEDINIPETVTSIGINAFNGCSSLTAITIPESVISIGKNAFSSCDKLTTINIVGDTDSIAGSPWGAVNAEIVWNYGK